MRDIGKNIKQFRIDKSMNQENLAEKLYVSRQTVSNYENGKSRPDVDMLIRIAEVLETDVNSIIYGKPELLNKRKKYIVALVEIVIIISLIIFQSIFASFAREYAERHFDLVWVLVQTGYVRPMVLLIVGWLGIDILSRFFSISPLITTGNSLVHKRILQIVHILIVLFIGICFVNLLPIAYHGILVSFRNQHESGSYGFLISREVGYSLFLNIQGKAYFLFLVLGIILRFLRAGAVKSLSKLRIK